MYIQEGSRPQTLISEQPVQGYSPRATGNGRLEAALLNAFATALVLLTVDITFKKGAYFVIVACLYSCDEYMLIPTHATT